ncbi:MAG: DegT/DnrJ/EryC1/StrS family aminotransferase [Planctomycetia bacterium]|nr:DegT/DnrJ/EryC1/StrS family aminotransferase [Planctomycetia bacterium]
MHSPSTSATPVSQPQAAGVPLVDMQRQYQSLKEELHAAVNRVLASGRFVLGPDCQELEKAIAAYCHVPHAIGCASGSDAILLALMALDVGPGDEVILPSYTFFATAAAVVRLGAKPVFVDIDPATFNIDPAEIAAAVTPATKAIMPVHLFGQCADMNAILALAARHKLAVVEDAAQAIGAEYKRRPAGGIGDVACFSFYPTKNLGGVGDGGMLTTTRQDLADRLRLLHVHGMQPRYYHQVIGINSRLDSLQAAVLNVKLAHLDRWTAERQLHARRYHELFASHRLADVLGLPVEAADCRHVWNQYTVRVPDGRRDELRSHLATHKIGTEIYYPVPLHEQQCFTYLGYKVGSLPRTEQAARETIALPIFPELSFDEQRFVVARIAAFFGAGQHEHRPPTPKFLKHPQGRENEPSGRKSA